eukprot:TRINITY_DN12354_c0_g1_i1.p1 TRINITY_DN12354_c0_g1~~TRINITY_DN12354_c0_g1_i1.p1  ORF type:complete len:280 (-),score=93.94 TRINITY_DN12354_c0_g1_i1:181-1020(-)
MASVSPFRAEILAGKAVLITGGATGINFGIARQFALHGARLAIMGRRAAVVNKAVDELRALGAEAIGVPGDVRSADDASKAVSEVVRAFGRLDVLVNGAAGNFLCAAEQLSPNAFKTVIEIDLVGTFNMSRAAFDTLRQSRGSILNISATLHYGATAWQSHPSAAKAGVDSLTRSLALEWGEFGIRVNGIAPGPIKGTEGIARLMKSDEAVAVQYIPVRRMGTVDDVAYTACFLSSEAASFISGHTVVVDGAACLYRPPYVSRETLNMLQQQRQPKAKL